MSEEENNFLKEHSNGQNSKWLGFEPFSKHPKDKSGFIFWSDTNIGNYSNFVHQNMCGSIPCCVYQMANGSWTTTECDYHYEAWCYITMEESHARIIASMDQLIKNVTEIIEKYPVEQLKSDNIKRLATILQDVKDVIRLTNHRIKSGSFFMCSTALFLSLLSLAIIVVLKMRQRKRTKNQEFKGIKRGSFRYSQRENNPLQSELVVGKYATGYPVCESKIQVNSYENCRSSSIDSERSYDTSKYPAFVTSQPQEV